MTPRWAPGMGTGLSPRPSVSSGRSSPRQSTRRRPSCSTPAPTGCWGIWRGAEATWSGRVSDPARSPDAHGPLPPHSPAPPRGLILFPSLSSPASRLPVYPAFLQSCPRGSLSIPSCPCPSPARGPPVAPRALGTQLRPLSRALSPHVAWPLSLSSASHFSICSTQPDGITQSPLSSHQASHFFTFASCTGVRCHRCQVPLWPMRLSLASFGRSQDLV